MRAIEELIGDRVRRAPIAGRTLDIFCDHLAQQLSPEQGAPQTVDDVAAAFRRFYQLPVPVAPHLEPLLETLGIGLTRHGNAADPNACSDFHADAQRWEIFVRYDLGRQESLALLREVFHILHRIGTERIPWWEEGMAGRERPRRAAAAFAYAVALPPALFLPQALCGGLDLWSLAAHFVTTPGACFHALARGLRLPFPYFQALLNFRPELHGQQELFFAERGVRAQVWKKCLKRPVGRGIGAWPEMTAAAQAFPRIGRNTEVDGLLYQAIKTGEPQCALTEEMGGLRLPRPVCLAARPNGTARSQMFVQIVPAEYADLLRSMERA
ncbi:MAG TPA: hypothetical protein VKU00_12380 [Chthonomonadaceae bacterium]|nr:hypothetical protein [Chthonomonadaceae bacterium]